MRKGILLALAVLTLALLVCGEEALAEEKDKKTGTSSQSEHLQRPFLRRPRR